MARSIATETPTGVTSTHCNPQKAAPIQVALQAEAPATHLKRTISYIQAEVRDYLEKVVEVRLWHDISVAIERLGISSNKTLI